MRGKLTALMAAVAAAAGAAGAARWARGRKEDEELELEVGEPLKVEPEAVGSTPTPPGGAPATDDLTSIKGLGVVKAAKLVAVGVTSYAQVAAWTDDDIAEFGLKVNTSPGQIKREDWVGQARALAEG